METLHRFQKERERMLFFMREMCFISWRQGWVNRWKFPEWVLWCHQGLRLAMEQRPGPSPDS